VTLTLVMLTSISDTVASVGSEAGDWALNGRQRYAGAGDTANGGDMVEPGTNLTVVLTGDNICTRRETFTVPVKVLKKIAYQTRYYAFCWSLTFRCSRYRIEWKNEIREEDQQKQRLVLECCAGYERSSNGSTCLPVCRDTCIHGTCVSPDTCQCDTGFGGKDCSKFCEPGRWGPGCQRTCPCQHGATCDPVSGACTCAPGYHGPLCATRCDEGRYGLHCAETCRCQNGGECDHVSGACRCAKGWRGALCDTPCPPGLHGSDCASTCQCQNKGSCNPVDGACKCSPGWEGAVCANPCPSGTYGPGCGQKCECYNGAGCDHVSGTCHCPRGYTGDRCELECPEGRYGQDCEEQCECEHGGRCDIVTGRCHCQQGWRGDSCQERICAREELYGPQCSLICTCHQNNTQL